MSFCREESVNRRTTKDHRSSLKPQLRGFPDFWGPMDPIGVRKSDFASLRMTVTRRSSANSQGLTRCIKACLDLWQHRAQLGTRRLRQLSRQDRNCREDGYIVQWHKRVRWRVRQREDDFHPVCENPPQG